MFLSRSRPKFKSQERFNSQRLGVEKICTYLSIKAYQEDDVKLIGHFRVTFGKCQRFQNWHPSFQIKIEPCIPVQWTLKIWWSVAAWILADPTAVIEKKRNKIINKHAKWYIGQIQSFIFKIFFVCFGRTLNTYIYIFVQFYIYDLSLSYHLLTTSLYVLVLVFNNIVDLLENFLSRLYGILKQSAQLGL